LMWNTEFEKTKKTHNETQTAIQDGTGVSGANHNDTESMM
jgi:hypothetical protein